MVVSEEKGDSRRSGLGSFAKSCFFDWLLGKWFIFFNARPLPWVRPELVEALKGAGELAVETGFVTAQVFEGAAFVSQGTVRESGAGWFVLVLIGRGPFAHLVVQGGSFHNPQAHETPTAHDHVFDQGDFNGALGLEALEDGVVEGGEAFGAFSVDGYGVGEEAVFEVALGRCEFPFRRDRASGFGAVATSGFGSELG
jgi:hypothetical protein